MKRLFSILGIGIAILAVAALVFLFFRRPAILAASCPPCFGFQAIGGDIYVSRTPAFSNSATAALVAQARVNVRDFFGRDAPQAPLLVCAIEDCYRRMEGQGGVSRAIAEGESLLVSPRGLNTVILTHELSHLAFRDQVGILAYANVPAWFDEGLAVYVSDDRRYLAPPGVPDRCLKDKSYDLPVSRRAWLGVLTHDPGGAYEAAACRVARWIGLDEPRAKVGRLIQRLHDEEDFSAVFKDQP